MRHILLLRGAPGSGKSTWIKENNLEQYTICPDTIRLMIQSPIMTVEGNLTISQKNDKKVWEYVFKLIEERMGRGEFVVVDATHSRNSMISRYKNMCSKYRYRCTVVDFADLSLEECLIRNKQRDSYKYVPDDVIKKIHARFQSDNVGGWVSLIKPNEFYDKFYTNFLVSYDNYDRVVVFGDIHGCYDPIKEYFDNNPFDENTGYVFCGDYFDRGIQNAEVFLFLEEFMKNKNVLCLIGNHEKHLFKYGFGDDIKEGQFLNKTLPQLEEAGIDKKRIKEFYRKLGQIAFFNFRGNVYLATHGGLSNIPDVKTATIEMVKGVGNYSESKDIDNYWCKNTPNNYYSIHGHRNMYDEEVFNTARTFNLCDKVEFGKNLRVLEITPLDLVDKYNVCLENVPYSIETKVCGHLTHTAVIIKNNTFDIHLGREDKVVKHCEFRPSNELIRSLCNNVDIVQKDLGDNIHSFNFSKKAFSRNRWNDNTIRARGLFVNMVKEDITARSYDKFFNWGQTKETETRSLMNNLEFPVTCYKKYNGFLGLLSYNSNTDDFFIASKSTNSGDYVGYFKTILENQEMFKQPKLKQQLKQYLKENNETMIIEVVDPINDPHIIKHHESELILLDLVKNTFNTEFVEYSDLLKFGNTFNLKVKEVDKVFQDWSSLYTWRQEIKHDYTIEHEGWVIEDNVGFKVKIKSPYYNFWKFMRSVKDLVGKDRQVDSKKFSTAQEIEFYNFLLSKDKTDLLNSSIITLREEYYMLTNSVR